MPSVIGRAVERCPEEGADTRVSPEPPTRSCLLSSPPQGPVCSFLRLDKYLEFTQGQRELVFPGAKRDVLAVGWVSRGVLGQCHPAVGEGEALLDGP